MKKMQCEVCGSNEIKKVADGVFECQSCGVQYSTEEVQKLLVEITGAVKIDHSDEVQNAITRAEQFGNQGDTEKAKEYYNKALDFDANNSIAQEGLNKVNEEDAWDEYYVIEADINPEENVKDFLKQLATTKNIVCDIYKYIKIDSVIEKYVPTIFVKQKCKYEWNATACNRYYEEQTVYKEKYNADLKRYVKEPVTEKVERISRTPVNGSNVFDQDGFALASKSVANDLSVNNDLSCELISDFETLQDTKYASYDAKAINKNKIIKSNDGTYQYDKYLLDINFDISVCKSKMNNILKHGDSVASTRIQNSISADFVENYHCIRNVVSETVAKIFIPVQIINYTYKGKKYCAVSDLLSRTSSTPTLYPCDAELSEKKDNLNKDNAKVNSNSGLMIFGWILFVAGLLIGCVGGSINDGVAIFGLIVWAISYFFLIPAFIQKSKLKKKFEEESQRLKIDLYYPRKKYLSESYEIFFKNYTTAYNFEEVQSNISENTIVIDTKSAIAFSGDISDFSSLNTEDIEQELTIAAEGQNKMADAKKKRILPICLMVGGFIFLELGIILAASETAEALGVLFALVGFASLVIVGPIMLSKVNKEINSIKNGIKKSNESWINE